MGEIAPAVPIPEGGGFEESVEFMKGVAGGFGQMFQALAAGVPRYEEDRKDIEIDGVDGNKIPLSIYQGTSKTCYYQTHGGGMAFLSSREEPFTSTFNTMAGKHGMTVVAVDYRTYLHHPDPNIEIKQFPAGLNDSYSGLEWLHAHK